LAKIIERLKGSTITTKPILSKDQISEIDSLEDWTERYQSPLQRMEHSLHGWVAYFIIPVFALANAGVSFNSSDALDSQLVVNIIICLVLGNSIGITSIILLVKKLKLIDVPPEIGNQQIIGVSFLAGIGFTMAIFIASLAFENNPKYIDSAKIGILIGSFISAIIGFIVLRWKTTKIAVTDTANKNLSLC
jgi:NhaA family Na+:H+ antiporter